MVGDTEGRGGETGEELPTQGNEDWGLDYECAPLP